MQFVVNSTFDVVAWLEAQADACGLGPSPTRILDLLYLTQAFYAGRHGGVGFMPAVFIAGSDRPIEPNVAHVLSQGVSAQASDALSPEAEDHLAEIWGKFGTRPADALQNLVRLDSAYKAAEARGLGTEITRAMMCTQFGPATAAASTPNERVVGGKRVRPWAPRAIIAERARHK